MNLVTFDPNSELTSIVEIDILSDYYIHIDASEDCLNRAYFKVYNSARRDKVTKVARISFFEPEYILGIDLNYDNWILSTKEKLNLITLLSNKRYSVWHQAIATFNQEKNFLTPDNWLRFDKNVKQLLSFTKSIDDVKDLFESNDFTKRRAYRLILDVLHVNSYREITQQSLSQVLARLTHCIPLDLKMPNYSLL